jgi:Uma2 family endonuclease
MVMQAKHVYTPEEYLALERAADYKSEYLNGEIYAMSGGTLAHAEIPMSISGELRTQLKGKPCHVYSSAAKVKTPLSGLFAYPDISVACGDPQYHDSHRDVLTNPIVIVEVLSDSTDRMAAGW